MSKALATKNVAAVLLGVGMILSAFAFATPASAQSVTDLQSQINALLAQIASLQGSSSTTGGSVACTTTFTQNLKQGSTGSEVMALQKFLNSSADTRVAASGAGSAGNETSTFGPATKAAVIKFQEKYAADILTPAGLSKGTGNWFASTRAKANALCATGGNTGTGTGTGTGTVAGTLVVGATAQPANSLAPMNATRVPFTNFTLTNTSNAAVTVNGVTVQRTGLANDNAFAGVILLDASGLQYGNSQTFNSNHQATIGGTFTLQPGQSKTFTVAGNMETSALGNGGQIASVAVVGINSTATVSGSLPISGASQTINETLAIGTATVGNSSFDPASQRSVSLGTTGVTFSGFRVTANTEDQKLFSVTWNQTGSVGSTDLANLKTVISGVSYPVTVDASGKYFSSVIPGGVLITKGNAVDVYIQGDLVGSNASNRTVEFDIYRASDVYLVGQTYGYGITPTTSNSGSYVVGNNTGSGFRQTANPFYFGATHSVTAGQLSTVSTASNVAPQNIAVNVPNQTLGGFTTNFTGEAVTVQSLVVNVASSSGATQLQNVTLVDQNGLVVAGPVDSVYVSSGASTITFNSSITFPTGSMTYTIKGKVVSGATNSATYTLSTNPSSWTSAVGQSSGAYVSLPTTTITMSTMTVQGGSLNVSASASPASTNITQNQNNYTLANIVLDATQSGEDVRLNSFPVVVNASSSYGAGILKTQLTNCQLFDGATALNSQSVGSNEWAVKSNLAGGSGDGVEANFVFTNSLTITKGTSKTLALKCNLGGSFPSSMVFSAGVHSSYAPTVTGASSGNTIASGSGLTVTTSASGSMMISTATLAATVPTPIAYSQVAGGTTGVTVGTFTLQPSSGSVNLQKVALKLNSNYASSSDLVNGQAMIYQGSTLVGTVSFNGVSASGGYYTATTTLASGFNLAQNQQTTFTVKADIASIGLGNSAKSGHEVRIGLSNANGTSGNTQVDSGALSNPSAGVAIFKSHPASVSAVSIPSSGLSDGRLIAFAVTANAAGPVGVYQFVFQFASSTGVAITSPTLYAYNDAGLSQPAGGTTNGIASTATYTAGGSTATTTISTPLQIGAGQTMYFLLKAASATYTGSASNYSITTTLKGDAANLAPSLYAATNNILDENSSFVWSPNSDTTSGTGDADWTNGYGVNGLPSIGLTQTRTQ